MIPRAIEALYLTALAAIPLVFGGRSLFYWFSEPKQYLLHLIAGVIALLWAVEIIRRRPVILDWSPQPPTGLVKIAGLLVALTFISTLLSPTPRWSFLGRDANNPGGEAIAVLSYAVIGAAIALRVTNVSQFARILWTITLTGGLTALYGIAQYAGWDGLGWGAGQTEVYSSLGNPIYFGSYLVLAGGACLMLWAMGEGWGWKWRALVLCSGLIGAGIIVAGGTGPQIAAAVLLAGTFIIVLFPLGGRFKMRQYPRLDAAVGALYLFAAASLTVITIQLWPSGLVMDVILYDDAIDVAAGQPTDTELSSGEAPPRPNVAQAAIPSTFRSRVNVWKAGWQLFLTRPWIGPDRFHSARQWFGYGPQMAYYAIPLTLGPQHEFLTYDNAHNSWMQALIETGLLGVIVTAALLLYAGTVLWKLWRDKEAESWLRLTAAVLGVVLVARSVEQLTGLARISDSLTWWAMLGLVVVLQKLRVAQA